MKLNNSVKKRGFGLIKNNPKIMKIRDAALSDLSSCSRGKLTAKSYF